MTTVASLLRRRALPALLVSSVLALDLLACHSGTPAAPEGSEIPVSCEFLTREVVTGNFEALIKAVVIDEVSDVPQVGVGVYFRVKSGPGEMSNEGPIRTDNNGRAQSVLIGRGATSGNEVTVEVSSGATTSEITLDVLGCFSSTAVRPVLTFSITPTGTVRVPATLTVDLSDSTDSDCPGGKPTSWRIVWGDGETTRGDFDDEDQPTHQYPLEFVPAVAPTRQATIEIEITDCQGLTDSDTTTVTFQR